MVRPKQRKYELIIVFNPNTQDQVVDERISKLEEIARNHSGVVEKREVWGKRSLAYPVQNFKYGLFVVLTVKGLGAIVSEMQRNLKLADEVLRTSMITKDEFAPDLEGRLKGDFTYGYRPPHAQFGVGAGVGSDSGIAFDEDDVELGLV
ncbi:MAG TPA: 30S ribosomal protein S6 [Oligoflexia bacterium]|nr:30S ribosomal protein S6 [Oligoflexia bacterium]HMP47943.1 30S ribosomal protein S6 [Oligoflexia bacterium]